jgi:microcystin-dependent protein
MTGAPVSRTTYAALFTALGVTYGAGNGSTTFNLPNQSRSVLVGRGGSGTTTLGNALGNTGGEEGHILITAEMPAHTHSYNSTGAFGTQTGSTQLLDSGPSGGTTGSTGGGLVHNNIQPSLVIMYIIRAY